MVSGTGTGAGVPASFTGKIESLRSFVLAGTQSRREFLGRVTAGLVLPTLLQTISSASPKQTTLIVAMTQGQLRTLDPDDAYEGGWWFMLGKALYDQLYTYRGASLTRIVNNLVTTSDVSTDGLTYVFNLNPKVRFSNGAPATADDLVFSFHRFLNLKGPGTFLLDGVKSIEKTGPQQIKLTLQSVNTALYSILTSPSINIVNASEIRAHGGTDQADAAKADTAGPYLDAHSAGSGPFVLDSWVRRSQLVLKRNPNYWGTPASVEQIIIKFADEPSTQRDLLIRGDAHIAFNLTPDMIAEFDSNKTSNIGVVRTEALATAALQLNVVNNPALGKPANWEAIRYAIDYDGLRSLYRGGGSPTASLVPPGLPGALPMREAVRQDVGKAKAALARAGNPDGFKFVLTVSTNEASGGVPSPVLAQKLAADLAQVGIQATLRPMLVSQSLTESRAGKLEGYLHGWSADYPHWSNYLEPFAPGGSVSLKRNGWRADASPEAAKIAELTKQALNTLDPRKQLPLVQDAQRMLNRYGPYAWLFDVYLQFAVRKDIVKYVAVNPIFWVDFQSLAMA